MGTQTLCDGIGIAIPEDTPVTGLFSHQYSDAARPDAQAYLDELDALHTKHAAAFAIELAELRAKYRERLMILPDEAP